MKILELQENKVLDGFEEGYDSQRDYVILSKVDEFCKIKETLGINEDFFFDCMSLTILSG